MSDNCDKLLEFYKPSAKTWLDKVYGKAIEHFENRGNNFWISIPKHISSMEIQTELENRGFVWSEHFTFGIQELCFISPPS